jgi:8-oxo-dGTP diphosphatase
MTDRTPAARRTRAAGGPVSIDVVIVSPLGGHLGILSRREPPASRQLSVPWGWPGASESLDRAARRIAASAAGAEPQLLVQSGAFGDGTAHPGGAFVSVSWVGVLPSASPSPGWGWVGARSVAGFGARHRSMVAGALALLRQRLDHEPIAFRMLPHLFTLSELQAVYETLLERALHKASFRRALHAAWLVAPTDEWRSEGRGRPAQLFRYAPRRRRGGHRGVRFDPT